MVKKIKNIIKKVQYPILKNVKIELNGNKIIVTATNINDWVEYIEKLERSYSHITFLFDGYQFIELINKYNGINEGLINEMVNGINNENIELVDFYPIKNN